MNQIMQIETRWHIMNSKGRNMTEKKQLIRNKTKRNLIEQYYTERNQKVGKK